MMDEERIIVLDNQYDSRFNDDFEMPSQRKSFGKSAEIFGVTIPNSSNREFPQFGRWIDSDGNVTNYNDYCFLRPARERFADYFHSCVERHPIVAVSEGEIQRWKNNRIKKTNIYSLEKIAKGDVRKMMDELDSLTDFLCRIDAECYQYGIATSSKKCLAAINNCYKPDNYYRWENLLYRRVDGRFNYFNAVFAEVESYAHNQMDKLDAIHAQEFLKWKNDPINRTDFLARQSLMNQKAILNGQTKTTRLMQQQAKRIADAEQRAAAAEQRAMSAESAAGYAEKMAHDAAVKAAQATDEANDANNRANNAEFILHQHGIW